MITSYRIMVRATGEHLFPKWRTLGWHVTVVTSNADFMVVILDAELKRPGDPTQFTEIIEVLPQ